MRNQAKSSQKMKIFPKGQVIIPVDLRRKYKINIGDHIEFISIPDGILLKPSRKKQSEQSQTDELFGIFRSYAKRKGYPVKEKIEAATESGFIEGWPR